MQDDTDRRETQDDVEGHTFKSGREPAEAADVQAHVARSGRRNDDGPPSDEEQREQVPDADDDVEGHAYKSGR